MVIAMKLSVSLLRFVRRFSLSQTKMKSLVAFFNHSSNLFACGSHLYLQIVDDTLKLKSENNILKKYDYPERGYIYDRKESYGCQSSFL
jgi:hypothetical protein